MTWLSSPLPFCCYLTRLSEIIAPTLHKFYIGNIRWGVVYLLLGVLGWITIFTGGIAILAEDAGAAAGLGLFGTICLFVLGILLLIDLFTIPRQIRKHYEKAEQEIINKLTANV
ncbi:MAG: hypothetical protein WAP24_05000 [Thermacetogeniaceae bacterium]